LQSDSTFFQGYSKAVPLPHLRERFDIFADKSTNKTKTRR